MAVSRLQTLHCLQERRWFRTFLSLSSISLSLTSFRFSVTVLWLLWCSHSSEMLWSTVASCSQRWLRLWQLPCRWIEHFEKKIHVYSCTSTFEEEFSSYHHSSRGSVNRRNVELLSTEQRQDEESTSTTVSAEGDEIPTKSNVEFQTDQTTSNNKREMEVDSDQTKRHLSESAVSEKYPRFVQNTTYPTETSQSRWHFTSKVRRITLSTSKSSSCFSSQISTRHSLNKKSVTLEPVVVPSSSRVVRRSITHPVEELSKKTTAHKRKHSVSDAPAKSKKRVSDESSPPRKKQSKRRESQTDREDEELAAKEPTVTKRKFNLDLSSKWMHVAHTWFDSSL